MKEKINVALLGPFPPAVGGIATNLQNLLASPLKEKYHFHCFQTTSKKCGSEAYHNEVLYLKILRVIFELFKYTIFLMKKRPGCIHINASFGSWSFWRDSAYMVISRLLGKPVFLQFHGGNLKDFLKNQGKLASMISLKLLRLPATIAVLSLKQKQPFNELGLGHKVRIFPNMIDSGLFLSGSIKDRSKFNLPENKMLVLFIAPHLFLEKGSYEFLEAASNILKNRKSVHFIVVGTGGEEAGMKHYCKDNAIQNHVQFLGKLPHKEVVELMHEVDVFTLPSYSEGFPMVILEAMAAGLPIISTDVGAISEIITDMENGFILQPKDYKTLAEKIQFLLKRPSLRAAMAEKNRTKVQQNYDLRVVSDQFDSLYRKVLVR